jgi:heat shock protein HtpX
MERKPLGRDSGLTVRMVVALGLLLLLYAGIAVGIVALVRLVPSWWPYWIALVAGLVVAVLGHYQAAESLALRSVGARLVPADRERRLHEIVARLAELADLPCPRVAVAETKEANAFTVGLTPGRSVVAVSRGLLERLSRGEVEAVVAHEIAHVANRDAAVMTVVSVPRTVGTLLAAGPLWAVVLFAVVWPLGLPLVGIGTLLTLGVSRYREYAADRGSALLTGEPEQLMSALQSLYDVRLVPEGDLRDFAPVEALCIVGSERRWTELLMDHPPVEKRLARLAEIARELGKPR